MEILALRSYSSEATLKCSDRLDRCELLVQQYRETLHITPDLSQWLKFPRDSLHLGESWLVALDCFPHGKDTFVVTGLLTPDLDSPS